MISSEVQRTLVKSPPELWSELSDPAALARHLGELGEVRIVRVEPEKLVEWAAENTTGTVSIQPSGWGTKVTLKVNREIIVPPADPQPTPEPSKDAPAQEKDPEPALERPAETEVEKDPEPVRQPQPQPPKLDASGENGQRSAIEIAAAARPAPPSLAPLRPREPEPPSAPSLRPPAPQPQPRSAVPDLPAPPARQTLHELIASLEAEPGSAAGEQGREKRRGFFGRLFGRGRRDKDIRVETAEQMPAPPPVASVEQPSREPTASPKADAFTAVRAALAQEGFAAADPPSARLARAAAAPQPPAPKPQVPQPRAAEPKAPEPRAPEPQVPQLRPEAETPELSGEPPAEQIDGISAELMAAEEVAAEEVTAVLARVLDRLGAAHHRPFSRS